MPFAPLGSFWKGNWMLLEEDKKPSVHAEFIQISWPSDEKE